MKKVYMLLAVVLVVAVSSVSFARSYPYKITHTMEFKLYGDDTIEVGLPNGYLEVIKYNGKTAKVRAEMLFTHKADRDLIKIVPKSYGDKIKNKKSRSWYKILGVGDHKKLKGDYTSRLKLYVPNGRKINAEVNNGTVKIINLSATYNVEVNNGHIIAENIIFLNKDENEFEIDNGTILVKSFDASADSEIEMEGKNATISMKARTSKVWAQSKVKAKVVNGSINLGSRVNSMFDIKTKKKGSTKLLSKNTDSKREIDISVINGKITVE